MTSDICLVEWDHQKTIIAHGMSQPDFRCAEIGSLNTGMVCTRRTSDYPIRRRIIEAEGALVFAVVNNQLIYFAQNEPSLDVLMHEVSTPYAEGLLYELTNTREPQ